MEKMFFHVSCKWEVENSDDLYEYTDIISVLHKGGKGSSQTVRAGFSVLRSLAWYTVTKNYSTTSICNHLL